MTCDNALANHKMVNKLHIMLLEFGRWASHTQCFLHTMNLVTKALLSQFDVRKGSAVDAALSEVEEHETGAKALNADMDSEVDDTEGLVDLMDEMDPAEWAVHEEHLCPVRLVLMKVRIHCMATHLFLINLLPRSASWHSRLSIQWQSYFWSGTRCLNVWSCGVITCCATFRPTVIWHMTCLCSHWSIAQQ